MNVNNSTDISSLISDSISKLNLKTKQAPLPNTSTKELNKASIDNFEKEDKALIDENNIKNKIDVKEIQKYAQSVGETLSIADEQGKHKSPVQILQSASALPYIFVNR